MKPHGINLGPLGHRRWVNWVSIAATVSSLGDPREEHSFCDSSRDKR